MDRKNSGAALKLLCSLMLLFLAACNGNEPEPEPVVPLDGHYVLVGCEGSFGVGNAAVSLFKPDNSQSSTDAFKAANGNNLGDVLQSITLCGDRLLLCVNNSDKLVAVTTTDLHQLGSMSIPKPRYVLPLSASKAYVSSLYSNKLYLVDPQQMQVNGDVNLPAQNPEGMLLKNNLAWVACWDTACKKLYAVNTITNSLADSISLPGAAPQNLVVDAEGKFWVLSGNVYKGKTAHLMRIDPASKAVLQDFVFPAGADPLRLCLTPARDTLFFLEVDYNGGTSANGVYGMSIHGSSLPQQAFVPAVSNQYFYGLGIEPSTGNVYVADPKGFLMQGAVNIYNPQGQLLKTFATGVGPAHFFFHP